MYEEDSHEKHNSALSAFTENPQDVYFSIQEPGEEVLLLLRKHPITNVGWLLVFVILLISPVLINIFLKDTFLDIAYVPFRVRILLTILWYLFCLGYALLSFLSWFFNIYLITDERIVDLDYFGFLFYRVSEAGLRQIQDVTYQVSGLARTLSNYGDVYIQTAADLRVFDFHDVPCPAKIHDLITDLAHLND